MLVNFKKLEEVFSVISLTRDKYIEGIIPIRDSNDNIIFEYKISIDFQAEFPVVKELEGLIPHDIERHLYPKSDWSLCLGYPLMLLSFWINSGYDCYSYSIKKILPYLANQHYFDRNGEWLIEGYDHDISGTINFYSETFNTDNYKGILYRLGNILKNRKYRRNDTCFCGSKLKYRYCHQKRSMTETERHILNDDYKKLYYFLNPQNKMNS